MLSSEGEPPSANPLALPAPTLAITALRDRFDKDNSGFINSEEFVQLAEAFGFGNIGLDIFKELDADTSKTLSYRELADVLWQKPPADTHTRQMIVAMAWDYHGDASKRLKGRAKRPPIDTSGWVIKGRDTQTVRAELQTLLQESGGLVADLVKLFVRSAPSQAIDPGLAPRTPIHGLTPACAAGLCRMRTRTCPFG